jgi:hypothetical protein
MNRLPPMQLGIDAWDRRLKRRAPPVRPPPGRVARLNRVVAQTHPCWSRVQHGGAIARLRPHGATAHSPARRRRSH